MITKAGITDAQILAELATESFIQSHSASATLTVLENYTRKKYHAERLIKELGNTNNLYHLISHNNQLAGFSKMQLLQGCPGVTEQALSKMEQLYLLSDFKGLKLGARLMAFNIDLSKQSGQKGMWLEVWAGNKDAILFYEKFGFSIIAEEVFPLTPDHSNPAYMMLMMY